jgi:hypothetical protein
MRAIALVLAVLAALAASGCTHEGQVRVFVRDPRAVWVEAPSPSGSHVVLPRGGRFAQVQVQMNHPPFESLPQMATVFREANGGITVEYPVCSISPYAPLHPNGELMVTADRGTSTAEVIASDGPNLRVAYRCRTRDADLDLDLTLVTPWSNVREIHDYEH